MPEASGAAEAVRGRLETLLGAEVDAIAETAADSQGSGGASYVATVSGRRLHVKRVIDGSLRLLSLERELALLESLRDEGIAPVPVAIDTDDGLLVTEVVASARALENGEPAARGSIAAVAGLLRRLHRSRFALEAIPVPSIAAAYLNRFFSSAAGDAWGSALAGELTDLAGWFDRWPEPGVVCHGDLVASNILRPRDDVRAGYGFGWRLIDFEYAIALPPVWDLASLSVMNGFDAGHDAVLFAHYYAGGPAPFELEDFAKVRRLMALLAHFWAHAQDEASSGADQYRLDP